MTSDALQKMRERCEKASRGMWASHCLEVWTQDSDGTLGFKVADTLLEMNQSPDADQRERDADFIAHAREDIPQLLDLVASQSAEIARLRGELQECRELLRDAPMTDSTRTGFVPDEFFNRVREQISKLGEGM